MEDCLISIIVCVYNVELFLKKCVKSIQEQSYSNLEIILIDDGSTDGSAALCDEFAVNDHRIRVVHKKNEGLAATRNLGIDIAIGEYVAFIDADDSIHCDYIKILYEICKSKECDIAQCDFLAVKEDSVLLPKNNQEIITFNNREAIHALCCSSISTNYVVTWNKLYKKDLFVGIRFPEGRIHEDEYTTYKLFWKANRVCVTTEYLYYYMRRPDSIMSSDYTCKRLDILDAYLQRLKFLSILGLEEELISTRKTYTYLYEKNITIFERMGRPEICDQIKKKYPKVTCQEDAGESIIPIEYDFASFITEKEIGANDRIVLYGAGMYGTYLYRCLCNDGYLIAGWVDNRWYTIQNDRMAPIDLLLRTDYDVIVIAIVNKSIQEKIIDNLLCWGLGNKRIVCI